MGKKLIAVVSLILTIVAITCLVRNQEPECSVYINEVVAANGSGYQDEDGDYVDWIELFNAGKKSISLGGFGLSDQKTQPQLWEFPEIELLPNSYLVICASGKNRLNVEGELHTNFKISAAGENLYFSDASGKLISEMKVEPVEFDKSFGCIKTTNEYAGLESPTPGMKNTDRDKIRKRKTSELIFSYPAGYYDDTIYLQLETEEKRGQIYYTTDGSTPDKTSMLYNEEEIVISERTNEPNQYTDIWCTPVDFWEGDGCTYARGNQYKATIIKARMYFPEEDCWSEKIWTNTYLIAADYTIPVVSLSLPEHLLFDREDGIYVPGRTMENYVVSVEELPSDVRLWQGNYSKDTKVLGYLELFENGVKVMENQVTLRICGAASRGNAQKSFTVYAWGNEEIFSYPVFGGKDTDFSSLRLRAFGNDWRRSMFRDALSQSLVSDLELGTQKYQPCILLINGEYFGLYEIRENRDEKFFETNFGIHDGNLIKTSLVGLTKETADEDGKEFLELIEFASKTDLSIRENYEYFASKMDIEQFIDYILVEQYLQNVDWPENNALVFKSKQVYRDSKYEDGKWRFVLYDLDYAINYPAENNFERIINSESYVSVLLRALVNNDDFVKQYQIRFEELLVSHFDPERAIWLQEKLEKEMEPEMAEALQRWDVCKLEGRVLKEVTTEYWYEKMNDLRQFFIERPEYARAYFASTLEK